MPIGSLNCSRYFKGTILRELSRCVQVHPVGMTSRIPLYRMRPPNPNETVHTSADNYRRGQEGRQQQCFDCRSHVRLTCPTQRMSHDEERDKVVPLRMHVTALLVMGSIRLFARPAADVLGPTQDHAGNQAPRISSSPDPIWCNRPRMERSCIAGGDNPRARFMCTPPVTLRLSMSALTELKK